MKLRVLGVAAAAATAAAMAFGVQAAVATPTFTVSGGPSITAASTGTSPQVTFVDTTAGETLTCQSLTGSGSVTDGTNLSGTKIGKITSTSFNTCSGLGISFTVTGPSTAAPWYLNATSGSSTGASGNIGSVAATVSGGGCVFTVTGSVPATYTNSTSTLAINGGGLTIATANSTCNLVGIYSGDSATFQSNLVVTGSPTAAVKVTSP